MLPPRLFVFFIVVESQLRFGRGWTGRPAGPERGLPAHEGRATQRHEVDLAGTAGTHGGEEDLMKLVYRETNQIKYT